jgi:hypothetical protein
MQSQSLHDFSGGVSYARRLSTDGGIANFFESGHPIGRCHTRLEVSDHQPERQVLDLPA